MQFEGLLFLFESVVSVYVLYMLFKMYIKLDELPCVQRHQQVKTANKTTETRNKWKLEDDNLLRINGYVLGGTSGYDVTLTSKDIPGVEKVDNTRDLDKPISNEQFEINALKANKLTMVCSANVYLRPDYMSLPVVDKDDISFNGDETASSQYTYKGSRYRRIRCQADTDDLHVIYMPNVEDYDKYVHLYIECPRDSRSFLASTARTDQEQDFSYIPVSPGTVGVFVSTGMMWAYVGYLSI